LLAGASYRLAWLAAKFGPEITLRDLLEQFSYDCHWRAEARSKARTRCPRLYLPDLEPTAPARNGQVAAAALGYEYSQPQQSALARMAWALQSVPRAGHVVLRVRGHQAAQDTDVVRAERG
jgi:hypothetical protein